MSNAEVFNNYCNEMMRLAIPLFELEMKKTGIEEYEVGQGIDFLGAPHPVGDAWLSEPYSIHAKTRSSKSGGDETVQITICPTQDWEAMLSVSSTSLDPVVFETSGSAEKDISMIRAKIAECFARLKAD